MTHAEPTRRRAPLPSDAVAHRPSRRAEAAEAGEAAEGAAHRAQPATQRMTADRGAGLFGRALLWLVFLGPFFFATYGFATWYTGRLSSVRSIVYGWETTIPLWPWTIVPYWSIDLLYGLSLLLCRNQRELDTHAKRLLSAQIVCVSGFLLLPLRYARARPPSDGLFGWLFDVLGGFDKPFNQAPSLHIALLVILWLRYAAHLPARNGPWRRSRPLASWVLHGWFALIGLSVLTTWQHHFIDLPSGALVGWLAVWLWPDTGDTPLRALHWPSDPQCRRLGMRYLLATLACAAPALLGGAWLWLLWPASGLALVAAAYLAVGPSAFQKDRRGRLSLAVRWLAPFYLLAAWLNSRAWTRRHPGPDLVVDDVWLGRLPTRRELARSRFVGVVDLCAELPAAPGARLYRSLPVLDLSAPTVDTCRAAAQTIETMRRHGPVLVCCALGYSRSATALAAWLLLSGRAADPDQACALLAGSRPGVVMGAAQRACLAALSPSPAIAQAGSDTTLAWPAAAPTGGVSAAALPLVRLETLSP